MDRDEEPLMLSSPAQFKALGHPVRHRLVNVLRQRPATLRQLGSALGMAKGTVSYHVRVLREAGLVELATTRQVRGGTEEYFALVSQGFRVADEDAGGGEFLVRAALAEMRPAGPGEASQTMLRHLWLSPDDAAALAGRLEEFATAPPTGDSTAGEPYGLLVSLFRADTPALPADEGRADQG